MRNGNVHFGRLWLHVYNYVKNFVQFPKGLLNCLVSLLVLNGWKI